MFDALDWLAKAWNALDGLHRTAMVLGPLIGLTLFVWGVFPALGQKKEETTTMEKQTFVINGPAQIGDGNVQHNTTVNVNAAGAYAPQAQIAQEQKDSAYHTFVRFPRTDGPWDSATQSAFQIKLDAPWQRYEIAGFPWAQQNVITSENPAEGYLAYSTATPPNARVVEFHFIGDRPMKVLQVGVSPRR